MKKVPYDVIQKGNLIKLFWLFFLFFNDVIGNLLNLYDNIGFVNKINICPCFVSLGVCVYSHCHYPRLTAPKYFQRSIFVLLQWQWYWLYSFNLSSYDISTLNIFQLCSYITKLFHFQIRRKVNEPKPEECVISQFISFAIYHKNIK